ncbi:MAG: endonuclease/exonuclease/phosphatase family protein [Labilithrix sp.]|nr:endonuclease/exonuclease/phosphatase family protein [Labilithrix sp.]MCW5809812.1 endonuclease/exonuclease/phosphatase family protein [Labilithrix sp.]
MSRLRVMTYNVHRCVGRGGRDSTADITAVIGEAAPDVVALQELDAPETDDDDGAHHARDIARGLGMTLLFCRTFRRGVGFYGHALLSRSPLALVRVTTFPAESPVAEPRGAIWAKTTIGPHTLDVVSTHLGVSRRERDQQSRELLGESWLGSSEMGPLRILCGDLNAVQHARTYRRFAARMTDVQRALRGHDPVPTFPAAFPVLRIDHVFVTPGIQVRAVTRAHDARARRASDHLPLIVDLELA